MPHRANISFPFLCYKEQLPEYCRLWMHCLVLHFQDGFPFPRCHDTGVRLSFVKTMLFCEQCNTSEMGKGKMEEKMWRQMWPDEEVSKEWKADGTPHQQHYKNHLLEAVWEVSMRKQNLVVFFQNRVTNTNPFPKSNHCQLEAQQNMNELYWRLES